MTFENSIRTVARFATTHLSDLSISQRVELFTALAVVMPNKSERTAAERQIFLLREAEQHQLEFIALLNS